MCGIAGLIGESKQPQISYSLISKILFYLEKRGEDATGLWGTQKGAILADQDESKKPAIIYHKEPTKSSEFVKYSNVWRKVRKFNPNLLLLHARAASYGVGIPSYNKNNHPFTSDDVSLAIIHNGRIPEYTDLKDKFKTFSNCDSEILLRIIAGTETSEIEDETITDYQKTRLSGIKKIWSLADAAHMAVAVGEFKPDGTRHLWLWRNDHRPLWLADMRETLGQIFFFSEPPIWYEALKECPEIKNFLSKKQRLIKVPTEQIFHMWIDAENTIVTDDQVNKFNIKTGSLKTLEEISGSDLVPSIERKNPITSIICNLGKDDEPEEKVPVSATSKKKQTYSTGATSTYNKPVTGGVTSPNYNAHSSARTNAKNAGWGGATTYQQNQKKQDHLPPEAKGSLLVEIESICEQITTEITKVKTAIANNVSENSISADALSDILSHLESVLLDIRGTSHMVKGKD